MQHVWGRDLELSLHLVILRDLPHTYSCTCLYSKKIKVEKRALPVLNNREFKFYWVKEWEFFLKHLIIFFNFTYTVYFYFYLVYFFLFLLIFFNFILGKPNKMGNLARWRHEEKVHEVCGILTWKSSPSLEQNAKVKLQIHEAKLCICSAWFLMQLSSYGTKEHFVGDGVIVYYSLVVYFLPCKILVDNKYSRNT